MAQASARDALLKPYLDRLPSMLVILKAGDVPIGNRTLTVNPWEHAVLTQALAAGAGAAWWQRLLVEGVAFKIKLLQDLASSPVSSDNRERLPDDSPLWADSAEGARLLDDLKAALNERIATGDKDNYKHLNEFRSKLFNFLSEVRHLENPGEEVGILPVSESLVEMDIGAPTPPSPQAKQASLEAALKSVQRMAGDQARPSGLVIREVPQKELTHRRRRFAVLLGLLAVSAAAAVFLLRPAASSEEGRIFTRDDFRHIKAVAAVESAPPKCIITVRPDEWSNLTPPLRRSILTEIGNRLGAAGYAEAIIQTPDGVRRAGWTAGGGIALR